MILCTFLKRVICVNNLFYINYKIITRINKSTLILLLFTPIIMILLTKNVAVTIFACSGQLSQYLNSKIMEEKDTLFSMSLPISRFNYSMSIFIIDMLSLLIGLSVGLTLSYIASFLFPQLVINMGAVLTGIALTLLVLLIRNIAKKYLSHKIYIGVYSGSMGLLFGLSISTSLHGNYSVNQSLQFAAIVIFMLALLYILTLTFRPEVK